MVGEWILFEIVDAEEVRGDDETYQPRVAPRDVVIPMMVSIFFLVQEILTN